MTKSASTSPIRLVTVAYQSTPAVKALLESLREATRRPLHVVVVDNSESPDEELRQICEDFEARYVSRPDNPGFGVSSNLGAQGEEPWVVLANPDLRFLPGTLDALIDAAESHPEVAIVGPALVDEGGNRYPNGRSFPYFSIGIGHALFSRFWPGNPWTARYWGSSWRGNRNAKVDWLSGACLVLRRRDWEALRGFDERFFMYFEDTDLGLKARRKLGKGSLLVAGTQVVHQQGASTGNLTAGTGDKNVLRSEDSAKTLAKKTSSPHPNPRALCAHHESAALFLCHLYPQPYWRPVLALIALGLRLRLALQLRHN